jgi:hypothetical protein
MTKNSKLLILKKIFFVVQNAIFLFLDLHDAWKSSYRKSLRSPKKHPELEISSLSFCATIRPLVSSSTL